MAHGAMLLRDPGSVAALAASMHDQTAYANQAACFGEESSREATAATSEHVKVGLPSLVTSDWVSMLPADGPTTVRIVFAGGPLRSR
jgi:guanyl-specific ribonuclease Sa